MLVSWLSDPACQEVGLSGGKAANLSRFAGTYPVPPGFCVTAEAYWRWSRAGKAAVIPPDVRESVAGAYRALAQQVPSTTLRVAVRSSAIGEDGRTSSFAGQYATYLNLSGVDSVLEAVGRCWASAQDERVQAYRSQQGEPAREDPVAVLIQQLVLADVAFVAFSVHPVTGQRDDVVITSNWGLGESVVDGSVVPDTYLVRKSDGTLVNEVIGAKHHMTVVCPGGVRRVNVPRSLRTRSTLSSAQASSIADLATRLERDTQWPVDIEGAYQDDNLYLLQCRPITTL